MIFATPQPCTGQDALRLLPQLATYLGHLNIRPQRYLQMTPDSPSTRWGAIMKDETLLGPWVRRFLLEHLVAERNLARNMRVSYRDTLALLLPVASRHGGRAIDSITIEDLTPSIVRRFLDHLERDRQCIGATRNQRLATLRSLVRFIGMRSPAHVAWCAAEIRATPFKKTAKRAGTVDLNSFRVSISVVLRGLRGFLPHRGWDGRRA